jgi:hypothetical protein
MKEAARLTWSGEIAKALGRASQRIVAGSLQIEKVEVLASTPLKG